MSAAPSAEVCAAFGAGGPPVLLEGGQGEAWRCGDLVIKPGADAEESAWTAEVASGLARDPRLRVVEHVAAAHGEWTYEGWAATRWAPGVEGPDGRWEEILAACDGLSDLVSTVRRPALLDRRSHRWAQADRMVWDGSDVPPGVAGDALVRRLSEAVRPLELPAQLVHGDLCGNILFDDPRPPLVIDLSFYWRPPGHARAMVVVDGLLWYEAPDSLAVAESSRPHGVDLLVRALLFRRIVAVLSAGRSGADPYGRYEEATDLVLGLARGIAVASDG